jgi:hypothetical protein
VLAIGSIEEYRAENLGMQSLDAAAEERRKTGDVLNVSGRYALML